LWWPTALFSLRECRPGDIFITDCYIHKIANSIKARLLLTIKVGKHVRVLESPPINAPHAPRYGCTCEEYSRALTKLWDQISGRDEQRVGQEDKSWREAISPERLALAHVLSPVKWIIGPMENLPLSIAPDIANTLLHDMLKYLCVDKEVKFDAWRQVYTLLVLDLEKKHAEVVIGSKKYRNKVIERYIFGNPNVYSDVENILRK